MAEVQVRQWSDHCFAAYVFDGDPYGTFVGTESTREDARALGESRCGVRVSDVSEHVSVGELGAPAGSAQTLNTGGRLVPLTSPGA